MYQRDLSEVEYEMLSLSEKTAYMIAKLDRLGRKLVSDSQRKRNRVILESFGFESVEMGVN
jgi:hypothetical protein